MSLYILPENQKILWDIMQKVPGFQSFGPDIPGYKEKWFKQVVHQFYEKTKHIQHTKQSLQSLNKETLHHMIQEIKDKRISSYTGSNIGSESFYSSAVSTSISPLSFSENPIERKTASRDYILEQKQNALNMQFMNRQKEYEVKIGPQYEIDFRESADDSPIENMEALVQQHLKQRELDIKPYDSPPIIQIQNDSPSFSSLGIVELSSPPKKTVQWSENIEKIPLKTTMVQLHEEINILKQTVERLQQEMNEWKNRVAEKETQERYVKLLDFDQLQ